LIGVLNSKVSHEWEKETVKEPDQEPPGEACPAEKPRRIRRRQVVEDLDDVVPRSSGVHQSTDVHREAEVNDLYEKVLRALGSQQALVDIFNGILQGRKPQELAEMLGISIDRIRTEQKRLERKMTALRKEWSNE
jgi:DNA-directed RNA polymerase specialized sigma24 family protein